jgi:hypothetical protein
MQIRMIFGTLLPPPAGTTDPTELKCDSVVTVDDATGAGLIADGRAEIYPTPTPAPPTGK